MKYVNYIYGQNIKLSDIDDIKYKRIKRGEKGMNVFRIMKRRIALFMSACMVLCGSGVGALATVPVYAAEKIKPYIAQKPEAADITEGQSLADSVLTGGKAWVSISDNTVVAGTFAWKTPKIKPQLGDTRFSVYFTPSDTETYERVEFKVSISINKAPEKPSGEGEGEGGEGEGGGSEGGTTDGGTVSEDGTDISSEAEDPIKTVTYGGSMVRFSKKNVVSSGSITFKYNSKMTYTGKKIKLPDMSFAINYDEMLPGVVSDPSRYKSADFFKVKYKMSGNQHASVSDDRPSDYVNYPYFKLKLKLNTKAMKSAGISASEIKAMKKRVRAMNKILDSREISYDIIPVDLSLPSTSVTGVASFRNGKLKGVKNVVVQANCNGQVRTYKLNNKCFYASVVDSQKGIVSITGKNDFMGTAVVK